MEDSLDEEPDEEDLSLFDSESPLDWLITCWTQVNRRGKGFNGEREREARGAREEREVTTQKSGARATRESKELTGRVSDVPDKN